MVRPVTSKRKLFNNSKDQFKENEPDQINLEENKNIHLKSQLVTSGLYSSHKSLNSGKKRLVEGSSCVGRREKEDLAGIDGHRGSELEDGWNNQASGRTVMPMSERQQIALLMQLSSPSPTNKSDLTSLSSPQTPTPPHFSRGLVKRNERGETPLHVASIKGDEEKVSQLISQGANVNATDYADWTALHEACNRGYLVIASLLIHGGADVNAKGLDNDTPLHDACVNNHIQIVKLLLKSGAKPDAINCRGKSPFDVCRSSRILALLEEAKSGKLENCNSTEKDFTSRVTLQGLEVSRDIDYITSSQNNLQEYSHCIQNQKFLEEMSRKTPPNNKAEEKPSVTMPSSSIPNSSASGLLSGGNGSMSSGGNGRPVSPRVTLRLPHVPRTPDKSQQRSHEKNASENEDIYEFRCSKEESKETENEEKGESGSSSKQQEATPADSKGDKRPRENDPEEEEELKKKRRKEEGKEALKASGRGGGGRPSSEKGLKIGQRSTPGNGGGVGKQPSAISSVCMTSSTVTPPSNTVTSSTCSSNTSVNSISNSDQRKCSSTSSVSSPKAPPCSSKSALEKSDSDSEDLKSESNSGAPKVPPLKIVLAPCSLSEQETSSLSGKNGSNRQLPYVVNSSSGNSEEKENGAVDVKDVSIKDEPGSTSSSSNGHTTITSSASSSNSNSSMAVSSITNVSSTSANGSGSVITSTNGCDKGSGTRITRSQRGGGSGGNNSSEDQAPSKSEPKTEEQLATDVVHPRKRKIKMKEPEAEQLPAASIPEQPISNCYEMFLKIRKQVERRRKLLFPVQPKPPEGFEDYVMNKCSYVLANSSNSQHCIPITPPPASLSQPLKDLFADQEQERYKLKLQQMIEKEKLVLSIEQDILRVHGRAARALANQLLPFSVCTILKDEEVYNVISPEQEEKDRNARSRYTGRLFIGWLQDVDDKWDKIKEDMVLRHHQEAESLHGVQKMDWEWKLRELGLVEPNSKVQIDQLHVPMVQVADFDMNIKVNHL